jgi:hypothetical protein
MRVTRCVPPFSMKAGTSPILYIERRALEWHASISYPPYNAPFKLGQNSGGARSYFILALFLPFLSLFDAPP